MDMWTRGREFKGDKSGTGEKMVLGPREVFDLEEGEK
jgi:hypothetical protein